MELQFATHHMGWLQWSASVIGSLAWPVAAVIIASIFRSQIAGLLAKVKKLSWGDKVVDFAHELDKIEDVSQDATPTADQPPDAGAPLHDERFAQLLAISPSAAILDAWRPIELRLRELGLKHSNTTSDRARKTTLRSIMILLNESNLISSRAFDLLRDLQNLRNVAAHTEDVTATDAIRFYGLAQIALRELDKA